MINQFKIINNAGMEFPSFVLIVFLSCALVHADHCKPSAKLPKPEDGCCGVTDTDRIIPGFFAKLTDYSWMGLVEYRKDNQTKLLCSAVLISGRYALSAAKCFGDNPTFGTPVNIRFGEHDTSNDGLDCEEIGGSLYCNDGALAIDIEKIITHPDFKNDRSHQHDIALIRLAKMVPFSDFISPICLPTSDITPDLPNHYFLKVAGWGPINSTTTSTNVLHNINVPFVNFDICKSTYAAFNITLENGQLCAGGHGTDPCKEDAGGPLMYNKGHVTEVAGIVSFGPVPCAKPGVPGVFTKVFAYDAWIRENVKE